MYPPFSTIAVFVLTIWFFYRESTLRRAAAYYRAGDYHQAIRIYTRAIWLYPFDSKSHYWRGASHEQLGDTDAAFADYSKAIKRNKRFGDAYGRRGLIYQQLGDDTAAIADFERFNRFHPDDYVRLANRGREYLKQRDYEGALARFNQAVDLIHQHVGGQMPLEDITPELRQRLVVVHFLRGFTLVWLGKDIEAVADFDTALKLMPVNSSEIGFFAKYQDAILTQLYRDRGSAYARLDQWEKAIADYALVLEHGLEAADRVSAAHIQDVIIRRIRAYVNLERWDEALDDCDYAEKLLANGSDLDDDTRREFRRQVHNFRGIVYARSNRHQVAIQSYTESLRAAENVYVLNKRGETYFALGQYDRSLEDFSNAHARQEDVAIAMAGLAATRHVMGRIDEALVLWRTLLEKDSKYMDVDWVKTTFKWPDSLAQEAAKIIALLDAE